MQAQPAATPNPNLIFETFNAFQRSAALKGAVDLEIFTAIAEGADTVERLAKHCHASTRGIRMLCDALVTYGLLTKSGANYALTPDTAFFLDRRSPAYLGAASRFLCHPTHAHAWGDIAATVRKGGSILPDEGHLSIENDVWVDFARGMGGLAMPAAQRIAQLLQGSTAEKLQVLDVAAGHGMYGIAIAQSNPKAEITALDWSNVLEVAKENAAKMGVGARYQGLPGSFFEVALEQKYDVVLLTNFLHHFDHAGCVQIIKKAKAALKPNGKIVTVEFVPDDDRVHPPTPAAFSLVMLVGTPAGDAYTFTELQGMFREAGCPKTVRHEIYPDHPQTILISE